MIGRKRPFRLSKNEWLRREEFNLGRATLDVFHFLFEVNIFKVYEVLWLTELVFDIYIFQGKVFLFLYLKSIG